MNIEFFGRMSFFYAILFFTLGFLSNSDFLIIKDIFYVLNIKEDRQVVFSMLFFLVGVFFGIFGVLWNYLNAVRDNKGSASRPGYAYFEERFSEIEAELIRVSKESNHNDSGNYEEFIDRSKQKVVRAAIKDVQDSLFARSESYFDQKILDHLLVNYSEIQGRLQDQITLLTVRGNLNLILGGMFAGLGIGILGYYAIVIGDSVSSSPSDPSLSLNSIGKGDILVFISRITLVFLIELFAYFFLRLYKSSFEEMKYYQNELTNTEMIKVALSVAIFSNDHSKLADLVDRLSATERNFVLKKGETTSEIEKTRLENAHWESLTQSAGKNGWGLFSRRFKSDE